MTRHSAQPAFLDQPVTDCRPLAILGLEWELGAQAASNDQKRGHTLWQTIAKFAPRKLWAEFCLLSQRFAVPPEDLIRPGPIDGNRGPDPLKDAERHLELECQLNDWMISELRSGTFEATAYSKFGPGNAKLERLTASNWEDGQYSWQSGELWTDIAAYFQIRVLPVRNERNGARKIGKKGRPSNVEIIERAWPKFCQNNVLAKYSTLNATFEPLRIIIRADNPDIQFGENRPSDSALYNVLKPLWGRDCRAAQIDSRKSD